MLKNEVKTITELWMLGLEVEEEMDSLKKRYRREDIIRCVAESGFYEFLKKYLEED